MLARLEKLTQWHYAHHRKTKDLFTELDRRGELEQAHKIWRENPKYHHMCHYECEIIKIYRELE